MPGNELGGGVRNFFVQDNPFQGQQQSQVAEGNWPVLNSSFPGGAGNGEYPFFLTHGSANGSDEQPIVNDFLYGNQSPQTTQNAANSDQRHFTSLRGFSFHELQQHGPDHVANASVSSEASASHVSFDLFGGHQAGHQQSNMPHFLQPRQSGINDMPQLLQQQLMIKKLQEQELQSQQLASRQDYSNRVTSNSNNLQSPRDMQGFSNGVAFQLNNGQSLRSVNLLPQQFDQSLYGFPVSNSRGLPETQYPQIMMAERYLMPQPQPTVASISSLHGNQSNSLADRVGVPDDESSILRHDFRSQNKVEVASKQSVNMGMKSRVVHQRVNSSSRHVAQETFGGKQQFNHSENSCSTSTGQYSSPKNESALDPEEEKILFGSDDNIWAAFGNVHHSSGAPGKLIDNGGLFDGLPSIQSGSWSALMQSAVAETSSSDAILQVQNSVMFQNNDHGNSARQISSTHNERAEKVSPSENNMRMQATLNSGSFTADNIKTTNTMVFNRSGIEIQETGHGLHSETSRNFVQPLHEDRYRFCSSPSKTSVTSQHHIPPERDTNIMMSGQTTTRIQDGWNGMAAKPPGMDGFSNHDSQRLKQFSQNTQDGQNMLEFFRKVDQTKDHAGMIQIRLSKDNAQSQPSDSKNFRLQSQSSGSQGFGLHLGPPSQWMEISQNSKARPSIPFPTVDESATMENGGSENSLHKMSGNVSSGVISGIPSSKSHLNDKISATPGIKKSINLFNDPFKGNSSRNIQRGSIETCSPDVSTSNRQDLAASNMPEQSVKNDFQEEIPSSTVAMKDLEGTPHHFFSMPGSSQQRDATMQFNIWSSVLMHHNSGQRQMVPSQNSDSQYHNVLESSSSPMQRSEECKSKESFSHQSESVSTDRAPKFEVSKEKESHMKKNHLQSSPSNSTSVLKEIEDFGRYLRPNSFSDQAYSLPKQTQVLKENYGNSKITDRPDNLADATSASVDSKMFSSSEPVYIKPISIPQRESITCQKDSGLNLSVLHSHTHGDSATFSNHQVSTQIAPLSFGAHESSKGGQICNAKKISQVKSEDPPLPLGKSSIVSNALNSEEMETDATLGASVVNRHCSSSLPQVNATGQNFVTLQQKKRKSATLEPQPWHKEISDDSRFLRILSMSEQDSSKTATRVNGIAETTEDANQVLRSKQRLIMSSHLMKQLIPSPPPSIPLSMDASISCDIVAYSLSRRALGDACHAVSYANNLKGPRSSANLPSEKRESPMKGSAQGYENAAKELFGKVTKLENDLSSLEKSASLLDLRLECQEVDKFATINRFARFHGRGQNGNFPTSTNANSSTYKFSAQRYVVPAAMPRNLPDTVNCLQL